MSVTDSVCLSQTVCVCHIHSVSLIDSLRLSQTTCVCNRHSVSVTTIYFSHRQLLSVTDVFFFSVRESMCLLQRVCVFPRQSVFVTNSLCLSQKVFFCLYQALFLIILGLIFTGPIQTLNCDVCVCVCVYVSMPLCFKRLLTHIYKGQKSN